MSAPTAAAPKTYRLPKASAARLKAFLDQARAAGQAYQQELGAAFAWLGVPEDIDLTRVGLDFGKATLTVQPEPATPEPPAATEAAPEKAS